MSARWTAPQARKASSIQKEICGRQCAYREMMLLQFSRSCRKLARLSRLGYSYIFSF